MSENKRRVIKYKPKKNVNVGAIVFLIILIYLVAYMFLYVTRDKISYYEVVYGTTSVSANKSYDGIIIREETVVKAESNGYVSHHMPDGSKTAIGNVVCSIDEDGKLSEILAENQNGQSSLSEDDFNDIKNYISLFTQSYDNNNFSEVYNFKSEIQSLITEKINYNNINNLSDFTSEDISAMVDLSSASVSGIVTYYTDGYEDKTYDTLKSSDFDKTNYKKIITKSNELINTGSSLYKIVTSENWGIVISLDEDDALYLADKTSIEVELDDSNTTYKFNFELITIEGKLYGKLTTNQYMITFLGQRFIDVKLIDNAKVGLKIPKTSLVEKDFYIIPKEFGTKGGNTNNIGFMIEVYDEDNNMTVQYVNPEIYSETEEYYYVSTEHFEDGDYIQKVSSDEKYRIGTKAALKGVYNINNGYCVFREVIIIDENSDYYIVESGTNYGLLVYDHIVLDSSLVQEEDIVYR